MDRESVLALISNKNWGKLLNILKRNEIFEKLSQDSIFVTVFEKYFVHEFIHDDSSNAAENITELGAIHTFHNSPNYNFKLSEPDYEKLILLLVNKTKDYHYAKEFPENEICRVIISEYHEKVAKSVKDSREGFEIYSNFDLQETQKNLNQSFAISIFKSPQEEEFYLAAKEVFYDSILLPNIALSTVLNNGVLKNFDSKNRWFFLSSTVDLVIIDKSSYMATHFFELDSSFHDDPEQIIKDELKNRLISEAGFNLHRIRKKTQLAGKENYVTLLKAIRREKP